MESFLDEMSDKILSDQLAAYQSGVTGQGETHQQAPHRDPSFSIQPPILTSRNVTWKSGSCELSPRLRRRIPAQFETDFLECNVCRSLSIQGWKDQLRESADDGLKYVREEGKYVLLLNDLESTWQSCPICRILRDIPLPFGKEHVDLNNPNVVEYIKVLPGFGGNGELEFSREHIAGAGKGNLQSMEKRLCYEHEDAQLFSLQLDIRPAVWPWLAEKDAAHQVKQWLTKCRTSHSSCTRQDEDGNMTLPGRLIDMGSKEGDPNKVIPFPSDQLVEYIALSYCWANSGSLKLTSITEGPFGEDVPWDEMPASWQDAIWVAGELGIQYLWIDALCIMQDSPQDWATESNKMGQVYRNATFVISADVASGDIGFLKKRQPPCRWIDLPENLRPAGFEGKLTVCDQSEGGFKDPVHDLFWTSQWGYNGETAEEAQNYTFHRGWCLQERYLATRVLHVTSAEMFWECREKTWCECGFSPMDRSPRKREFHRSRFGIFSRDIRRYDPNELDPWWELVREYTARDLSFDSDRLVAIAGLAKEFKTTELGEYAAGIWRNTMPCSLLWTTSYSRRTNEFVAPTWSWASTVGPVSGIMIRRYHSLIEAHDIFCRFDDPDSFTSIRSGKLQIRAPVIRGATLVHRSRRQVDYLNRPIFEQSIEFSNSSITAKTVILDFVTSPPPPLAIGAIADSGVAVHRPWYAQPGACHGSRRPGAVNAATTAIPGDNNNSDQEGEFQQEVVILIVAQGGKPGELPTTDSVRNLAGLILIESEMWPGAMERIGAVFEVSGPAEVALQGTEQVVIR